MCIFRLSLHVKQKRFGGKITSFNSSRTSKTIKLKMSVSGNAKMKFQEMHLVKGAIKKLFNLCFLIT